jgi:flagellin
VANVRGEVGAIVNRLENTLDFTTNSIENLHASESTVRDVDYARATSSLARSQILRDMTTSVMVMARIPVDMVMGLLT